MEMMKRSVGQSIKIRLSSLVDPATPIGEVFRKPVGILLIHSTPDFAQFAVYASDDIVVVEEELTRER
jgi:hypothetical protein